MIGKKWRTIVAMGMAVSMCFGGDFINVVPNTVVEASNYGYVGTFTEVVNGVEWEYQAFAPSQSGRRYISYVKPKDKTQLTEKNIVIPSKFSEYPGYEVTGLASNAFSSTEIESVEIPEGMGGIESEAFADCPNLKIVKFPSHPIGAGYRAFANCKGITTVNCYSISNDEAFQGCINLKEVNIYSSIGSDVINISKDVFKDCTSLEKVNFINCDEKTEIRISEGAFYNTGLRELAFDYAVEIEGAAFENCKKLTKVTFNEDAKFTASENSGSAFQGCIALQKMNFKKGVTGFSGNISGLKELEFEGAETIGGTLSNLPNLEKIIFYAYNPIISLVDATDSKQKFDIVGYEDNDGKNLPGRNTVYQWAETIGKSSCFKSMISTIDVKYIGTQIVGVLPKKENVVVTAYYYDNTHKTLKPAISEEDLTGYQLIMSDIVSIGSNPFSVKYLGKLYTGSFVGVAKQAISLKAASKKEDTFLDKEKGQFLQDGIVHIMEGQQVTKEMFDVTATSNNGESNVVSDYTFGEYSTELADGETSKTIEIPILYREQVLTVNGMVENKLQTNVTVKVVKREISEITADYGDTVAIGKELELSKLNVTVKYNDGTIETLSPEDKQYIMLSDQVIKKIGMNVIEITYQGKKEQVYVEGIAKKCEKTELIPMMDTAMQGCVLDNTFFKIIKTYSDGSREEIFNPQITLMKNQIVCGENHIQAIYEGVEYEVLIQGIENEIVAITARYVGAPVYIGDSIQLSDIQVIAHFKDGRTAVITDGYLLLGNALVSSTQEQKKSVTYYGLKTEVQIDVKDTVGTTITPSAIATPEVITTPGIVIAATPEVTTTPGIVVTTTPEIIPTPDVIPVPTIQVTQVPDIIPTATPILKGITKVSLKENKYYVKYGTKVTPKITVASGKKTLTLGRDYTVTYQKNKKYGQAKVIVTGKGSYKGTITKKFMILPPKVVITNKKIYNYHGRKAVKVTWKKQKGVLGYEVFQSTKKNGKYKKITSKDSNYVKLSLPNSKLYIKVRAYIAINGSYKYGKYSKAKVIQ